MAGVAPRAPTQSDQERLTFLRYYRDHGRGTASLSFAERDELEALEALERRPCECGAVPIVQGDHTVCANPACDGYGQICGDAPRG